MSRVSNGKVPISLKFVSTKLVYSIYALAVAFDGFLLSFPGAIYVQLQKNLNTSVVVISWIYTALSIGYIVSNVACGCITDYIKESHRLQSAILFVCGISVIWVPFTDDVFCMFILFVIIGIGWASNETHYTLFVFRYMHKLSVSFCHITIIVLLHATTLHRLYPTDGPKMYFMTAVILFASAALSAFLIQLSISLTGSYLHAFVIFGSLAILHCIAILFFETPQHDEYRAIKRRAMNVQKYGSTEVMDEEQFAEATSMKLKESRNYQKLQNVTIALLLLSMGLFAAQQGAFLSFTSVYCRDYLHIEDRFGRFLITCFWSGSLLISILRQIVAPNSSPMLAVVISTILRSILQALFIALSTMPDASIVFLVMYGVCGLSTGMFVPAMCSWAELIRPTTGLIACLWWVFYGVGIATMTFATGALIEQFGAEWIPFIICVPLLMVNVVNTVAVVTYKMIQKQELIAFEKVKQVDTDDETDTETVPPSA